jgi:hypothetical protein
MSEEKECAKTERALFNIIAINLETDEIVYESKVIAEGEKEALYESDLKEKLAAKSMHRDDVHLIITEIGPVPGKRKPKKFKVLGQVGNTALMTEEK